MPSLRETQEQLRDAVLRHDASTDVGVEIYRYAYGARLTEALRSNYPVLARRLGPEAFGRLARRCIEQYPSRDYNIRWFGSRLWQLLDGAYVDLARMEWALGMAFDARDVQPLAWEALRSMPLHAWAELPIALHPATQVLAMSWTAEKIWEDTGDARRHEHTLLVWRKGLQAHWRSASPLEGAALRALRLGNLSLACCAVPEAEIEQVGAWFAGWVSDGMLVRADG
jgi:hypothetical protein